MHQHDTPVYSAYLHCLHDESEPHGHLGRGTHYSVFRTPTWLSSHGTLRNIADVHDVAVIWDEDHDFRVIQCLEALYMNGKLHPVLFAGERKGGMTIVFDDAFVAEATRDKLPAYCKMIEDTVQSVSNGFGDPWSCEFGAFDRTTGTATNRPGLNDFLGMLVHDNREKVETYLANINNLWQLGHKPYR